MDQLFHAQLANVFEHLSIESEDAFSLAGRRFQVTPNLNGSQLQPHPMPAEPLVRDLQAVLYAYCYSRPFKGAPLPQLDPLPAFDHAFVAHLSGANRSRETWDQGWSIYLSMADGRVFARKGDCQHMASAGDFVVSSDPHALLQAGTTISLLQRRESIAAQPGFYFAYGEAPNDVWDDYALVRFYFHVESAGAAPLLEQITSMLNAYDVPFQYKTLSAPAAYDRTDAAVLYLARRYYEVAARLLFEREALLGKLLRAETPLFTRQLMKGIGVADDPGNGESFGMNRCRLVAEGLADAFRLRAGSIEDRMNMVQSRYALNRLSLSFPHLGAGLVDYPVIVSSQEAA